MEPSEFSRLSPKLVDQGKVWFGSMVLSYSPGIIEFRRANVNGLKYVRDLVIWYPKPDPDHQHPLFLQYHRENLDDLPDPVQWYDGWMHAEKCVWSKAPLLVFVSNIPEFETVCAKVQLTQVFMQGQLDSVDSAPDVYSRPIGLHKRHYGTYVFSISDLWFRPLEAT